MPSRNFHDNHVEVAVDRFQLRQAQLHVEAHDLGDHITHPGQQLPANVFDLGRLQPADFLHHREGQRKCRFAAAHKQRLRNDQGQRNFYGEARAMPGFAAHFDFTVQRMNVGAHHVESHTSTSQFGHRRSRGKARTEQKLAQLALRQFRGSDGRHRPHFHDALADAVVIDAAAIVFHFDEYVIAAMIGPYRDVALFRFARALPGLRFFHAVRHRITHQMNQRIGNVLNNIVVEFGVGAFQRKLDGLAGGIRRVADRARKARVQIADGHHARGGNFVLQVVRQLGEFINVRIDPAHEPFELGQHHIHVRRNFGQRARQNTEIVVTVHFEFAEFQRVTRNHLRHAGERRPEGVHLRRERAGQERWADAAEFVLFLELGNFAGQPALRKIQNFDQLRQFRQAANHARSVDDQLADCIHHAIQAVERDAHGFGLWQRRLLRAFCGSGGSSSLRRTGIGVSRGSPFGDRLRGSFRNILGDSRQQQIHCRAHFQIARPLAVQKFLQNVHRLQADVHNFSAGVQRTVAQLADQILDAMRHRRQPVQSNLRRRTFNGVHRPEQAINLFEVRTSLQSEQTFGDGL